MSHVKVCVLISAGAEWRAFLPHFKPEKFGQTPYGEYFISEINGENVVIFHGGSGKVAAAGSTQYAIDRWAPKRIINLGTCGGFVGKINRGEIILASKTIIYDILEQMADPDQAIEQFSVRLDLSWLPGELPQKVQIAPLLSADRDIVPADTLKLFEKFNTPVADWESGAIAWVASQNRIPVLILRAVSDLVGSNRGEAYGNHAFFVKQCQTIMAEFAHHLHAWIKVFQRYNNSD
jgi:adenosylhomocysteine nucleosidase